MGNTTGKEKISLEKSLLNNPRGYSFETTIKIINHGYTQVFGKSTSIHHFPFYTNNVNVFYLRGTEIEKITINETGKKIINIGRLSIAGLNAPLPTPYSELLCNRNKMQDFAMEQFLNIFHSRLLGISYRISQKRHICLQQNNYPMLNAISCFFGTNHPYIDKKFSRLCYIFWLKEKSVMGIEIILKYIFPFNVKVQQFNLTKIKQNNKRLKNINLGIDFYLGKYVYITNINISIYLFDCSYSYVRNFINNTKNISLLKNLIKQYAGDFYNYSIFIKPNNAPELTFKNFVLGKTSWLKGNFLDNTRI